jgi:hypothetical protein
MHASFWLLIGFTISLTPEMSWHGVPVRLPHAWLASWFPLYRFLRQPTRLGIAGLVGVALLAGLAFAECERLARRVRLPLLAPLLAVVVLSALYVQYARGFSWPFFRRALPASYPIQAAIAASDPILPALRAASGPVLELPIEPEAPLAAAAMYRSIFHWRPVVNGYSSYYPAEFPSRMALAQRLPDPAALASLDAATGLATVLVHVPLLPPRMRAPWLAAIAGRDDLRMVARAGDDLLFAVVRPAAGGGITPRP